MPDIKQMLSLVFGRVSFDQPNMSTHFIAIIPEINKFAKFISGMRFMGSKNCNDRISTYPIESVSIAGNNPFQGMIF